MIRRRQYVTIGDDKRHVWQVRDIDTKWAVLRDERDAICSVPVSQLKPYGRPSPWPLRVGVAAVCVFAGMAIVCEIGLARGPEVLTRGQGLVLLGAASAAAIALMVLLIHRSER